MENISCGPWNEADMQISGENKHFLSFYFRFCHILHPRASKVKNSKENWGSDLFEYVLTHQKEKGIRHVGPGSRTSWDVLFLFM